MNKTASSIEQFIFWSVLIIFFLVSFVPFFALKQVTINGYPAEFYLIGGGVAGLVVLTLLNQGKKITGFDKWLIFLMFGLSLSLFTSIDRTNTLKSLASFFLRGAGVAFIASRVVNTDVRRNYLVKFVLFTASLVCLIALLEFFTGKQPIFQNLYVKYPNDCRYNFGSRCVSTLGHPLVLSAYLVMLLPLAVSFLQNSRHFYKFIPLSLIIPTIFLTFSRSSWLAGFFALLIYFSGNKNIFAKRKVIFISLIILLSLAFVPRVKQIFKERVNAGRLKAEIFTSHRFDAYKTTWQIFKNYPFFGVGLGNYPAVHEQYRTERMSSGIKSPDNIYLRILCDTGLAGVGSFLIFVFYWLVILWKKRQEQLILAIVAGLTGFMLNQFAADLFFWLAPQFLFWLLIGAGANSAKNDEN
ncbi:MAG: O-antigen ligase family protein [Elusimicrobiota bacterium]